MARRKRALTEKKFAIAKYLVTARLRGASAIFR
jgi:hypothetical protein